MKITYMLSRILKKMRGSAIANSDIDKTSKIESGSQIINTSFGKFSFCGYDYSIMNCKIGLYEIWLGNPVRFIRKRFDDDIMVEL